MCSSWSILCEMMRENWTANDRILRCSRNWTQSAQVTTCPMRDHKFFHQDDHFCLWRWVKNVENVATSLLRVMENSICFNVPRKFISSYKLAATAYRWWIREFCGRKNLEKMDIWDYFYVYDFQWLFLIVMR